MRIKSAISRLWLPAAVVCFAALQSFGMDLSRNFPSSRPGHKESPDTVIYTNEKIFTKFRDSLEKYLDSLNMDSLYFSSEDTIILARDTIQIPDSLRYTDPFRYKWYLAIVDSLTHAEVRDSLKAAGDSLIWPKIDSLYYADSTARAKAAFEAWYASLSKEERKKYDFKIKMERRQAVMDSLMQIKEEKIYIRDSITMYTPRILETFALPDSLWYKRVVTWNKGEYFNELKTKQLDTSFNYWFNDYPFFRSDVNASYLGISGSALQTYDFFKRRRGEGVSFYEPYESWTYSAYTLPMFNTKTPYTELAYWGTLFADSQNEENELHILTTQNILPELNFTLSYDRFGANGLLDNEAVDNRTFTASMNYIGKRYAAHFGYIYNKVDQELNGGIQDSYWIRDTTVGPREIDVNLTDASALIKKNSVFLDQTYRIPFTFLKKLGYRKEIRAEKQYRDSIAATGDSALIALVDKELALKRQRRDLLIAQEADEVTTAFIGHSSEYSVYRRLYYDDISASDSVGRAFYNDTFLINPTESADSVRVMRFENKFFIKLQPWSADAAVSNLNVGIGNRMMSYYMFQPNGYMTNQTNTNWNSTYIYGGASGQYRNNILWEAQGYYTFMGDESGDMGISADATLRLYPFRRHRKSPLEVGAHFETTLDKPEYFEEHYYSNHYSWDKDFDKKSVTKIEGRMSVPHWELEATVGYSLLSNNVYYDSLGIVQQNGDAMSVFKVSLSKNFSLLGFLHLENSLLYQHSTNQDALPLPDFAANLRWYIQLNINKQHTRTSVMNIQLGANMTYNSKWYAPGFNPAVGVFMNQKSELYGASPYIDLFANIRWKRACIFVKMLNVNMGWPNSRADYFSAAGYIRPESALKFGIYWPFYTQPSKTSTMSSRVSGGSGSGGSGSSSGSSSASSAFSTVQ